jgi:hypothetical protein
MKHIKIFEDFRAQVNEGKETALAPGFVNDHMPADGGMYAEHTAKTTYFVTHDEEPEIRVVYNPPGWSRDLVFQGVKNWADPSMMNINYEQALIKDLTSNNHQREPQVWAKDPAEATSKAYEILAKMSHQLTPMPGDPQTMGNLIKSLFQIRKMYPEYSSKNTLFTAFINGLASLKPMSVPNFGIYNKAQDQGFRFANNMPAYQEEIFKALKSSGAYPA